MIRLELHWKWLDSTASTHLTKLFTKQDTGVELSTELNVNHKWLTKKDFESLSAYEFV